MATGENAGHAWATGSRACSWTRQLLESPRDDKVGWGEWVWVGAHDRVADDLHEGGVPCRSKGSGRLTNAQRKALNEQRKTANG